MLLHEISRNFSEDELKLFESVDVFKEIKNIVQTGVNAGIEKIARNIHDFATSQLHRFDRSSKEFQTLNKIIANPKIVANQLMVNIIKEIPVLK